MRIPETETGEFISGNPGTGKPGSMLTSEYMNSDLREKRNILAAVGMVPNPDDDSQIRKAIAALIAAKTKVDTPPRFDNTTLIATTAFVQRAMGGLAAAQVVNASRALTMDDVNTYLAVAAGIVLSLPPVASVPSGSVIEIGLTGGAITVTSTENKILLNANGAATGSVPVRGGSHARFLCTGSYWIFLGPASLAWDSGFSSSLITNGHQALPSGFMIQQGITGNISPGSNVTVTFPRAFPNAAMNFFASVTVASNSSTPASVSGQFISSTQGRVYNWSASTTLAAAWLAVGF